MASPSSTSSSERSERPTRGIAAGLLAIALVLAADAFGLGVEGAWGWLDRAFPASERCSPQGGVVKDHLALRSIRRAPSERARVFFVGSSRACAAFRPSALPEDAAFDVAPVTHASIDPFVIRTMVATLVDAEPDVTVFLLSEFDTHRVLVLRPAATFGDVTAVAELAIRTGAAFSWRQRATLYRLLLASGLRTYRHRVVLQRAGFDSLRRFEIDERLARRPRAESRASIGPPEAARRLGPREFARVRAEIETAFPGEIPAAEFLQLHSLAPGGHAAIQQGFLERSFEALRRAGSEVIVIEGPLHPSSARIYDVAIRDEFLAFMASVGERHGVRFVPLEAMEPFAPSEFRDLTHLRGEGSTRFTHSLARAVEGALAGRNPRTP